MLIPTTFASNFQCTQQKNGSWENTTAGDLICCGKQRFALEYEGEIKYNLWGTTYLLSQNGRVALTARCKECGRNILVFDNASMGYDRQSETAKPGCGNPMRCRRCGENNFFVSICLEYPDDQDLQDLDTPDTGNAFTWIRVTLKCNNCGNKHSKVLNYETG